MGNENLQFLKKREIWIFSDVKSKSVPYEPPLRMDVCNVQHRPHCIQSRGAFTKTWRSLQWEQECSGPYPQRLGATNCKSSPGQVLTAEGSNSRGEAFQPQLEGGESFLQHMYVVCLIHLIDCTIFKNSPNIWTIPNPSWVPEAQNETLRTPINVSVWTVSWLHDPACTRWPNGLLAF